MIIPNEDAMIELGRNLAKDLELPKTIELLGDLGSGKTTLVKGIAAGLGITDPVTSPSFSISNSYFTNTNGHPIALKHYDFYRIDDPGILGTELLESINQPGTLTIIEWADPVAQLLPPNRIKIRISYLSDDSRQVEVEQI